MPTCQTCQQSNVTFSNSQLKKSAKDRKCNDCLSKNQLHDFNLLFEWLKDANCKKVQLLEEKHQYRSLHANQRIMIHNNILSIPHKYLMTMIDAKQFNTQIQGVRVAQTWLALYLLHEKSLKQSSFYYHYISMLPKNYKSMPLYFNDQQMLDLKESICYPMLLAKKQDLYNDWQLLQYENKCTLEEFLWARTCVITRVFNCQINHQSIECLVPIADMMNHAIHPNTHWYYNNDTQSFDMKATRCILKNTPLSDSYGFKCNSRFFINYGFLLDENQNYNQAAFYFDNIYNIQDNIHDDGFSGYKTCQLFQLLPINNQIRFQVPIFGDQTSKDHILLIQKLFSFARQENNFITKFQNHDNEQLAIQKIGQVAKLQLEKLQVCKSQDLNIMKMLIYEMEVLEWYIEFSKTDYKHLKSKYPIYWNKLR